MADYISRTDAIQMIEESNAWHPECAHVLGPLRREIMNHQPADVRPVVLCRDCERRDSCRTSNIWAVPPGDDWFCADGKRRGADMRPEPPEREAEA